MKSISKRKIEVTLFPIVILLGIASGLMFCSFLLGYSAGNKVGFKEARDADVVRMTRTNVGGVIQNDITRLEKSKIYTKLQKKAELEDEASSDDTSESLLLNDLLAKKKEQNKKNFKDKPKEEVETIGSLIAKNKKKKEEQLKPKVVEKTIDIPKTKPKEEVKLPPRVVEKKIVDKKPVSKTGKTYLASSIPKGWYAQVAAPTDISEANNLADKLHSSGFRLVVEKAVINKNTYYRVLVGAEKNRTQALRLVDQLVREPFIKTTPFVRKIS